MDDHYFTDARQDRIVHFCVHYSYTAIFAHTRELDAQQTVLPYEALAVDLNILSVGGNDF